MAKKKSVKKAPGGKGKLNPEQTALLEGWLNGLEGDHEAALGSLMETVDSDPHLAEAMALALGGRPSGQAAWIAAMAGAEAGSKAVRKAAKKSAYSIRSQGFEAPETVPVNRPVFKAPQTPPAIGFMTGYHADGCQLTYICLTSPGGRSAGGAVVTHFVGGFHEVSLGRMRPSQLVDMVRQTEDELSWPPVEMGEDDLVWLLNGALELTKSGKRALDNESSFIAGWLEEKNASKQVSAPVYARLGMEPGGVPQVADLRRLREVLEQPPCLMWWLDLERWSGIRPEMESKLTSDLVLSEAQQADRLEQVLAEVRSRLFPADEVPCWQRRLEETATYLEISDRPDEARACLAAAMDPDHPDNPLYSALMERAWSTEQAMRAMSQSEPEGLEPGQEPLDGPDEPEQDGGLILPPGMKS